MAKWELSVNMLYRDDVPVLFLNPSRLEQPQGHATIERIVALLNAAEPGGDIHQILEDEPSPAVALRLWRLVDPKAVDDFVGGGNARQA